VMRCRHGHGEPPPIPLFGSVEESSAEVYKLLQDHESDLAKLLHPLNTLSEHESRCIGADELATQVATAWEANAVALRALLDATSPATFVRALAPSPNHSMPRSRAESPSEEHHPLDDSYSNGASLIAHLVRDWSADGASARVRTHWPVLRAVRAARRRHRRPLTVLVPGAGACRLAWEIARAGHRVEANDASAAMLLSARSIMRAAASAQPSWWTLYPRIRCSGGVAHRAACHAPSRVPDKVCAPLLQRHVPSLLGRWMPGARAPIDDTVPGLTLQVGSWLQDTPPTHRQHAAGRRNATFDLVVTSYFLDTQRDPAAAVRRVRELLEPGGVWVNVGPLLWHDPTAGLMRLTLHELLRLARLAGFQVGPVRTLRRVPYIMRTGRGLLGTADSEHDCVYWEAHLPSSP
jgi:SAM-dependent methyltransferase